MARTHLKKVFCLTMAVLMTLSMVACGNSTPAASTVPAAPATPATPATPAAPAAPAAPAETTYKDRIVFSFTKIVEKLNPASHNSENNGWYHSMTHNSLVGVDYADGNKILPELAKEWTVSDDGLTYTFKLEQGVKFHDGSDFNAKDVIFTINEAKKSSYQVSKLANIVDMEAVDDYTVKLTLDKPNSELLSNLGSAYLSIICEEALAKDADNGYKVGTGAYVFTEWVPNDYALLTRNENYWGKKPETKEFLFRKISEGSARVIALQNGEIDICYEVPALEIPHVEDDKDCEMLLMPSNTLDYLSINTKRNDMLANLKVRQAIFHAIDREELALVMHEGRAPVADGLIPPTVWGYAGIPTYEYDVEKSKALLTEAGYPNGITIGLLSSATYGNTFFEVLQAQLAKANIKLELTSDDASVRSELLKSKEYDTYVTSWTFGSINTDLRALFYTGSSSNRSQIADPHVDEVIDKTIAESDANKNLESYKELTQYLTDQYLIIPLWLRPVNVGHNKTLEGAVFYPNARHEYTYATVAE